jgi:nitroimidazol reductase NimA-like FMN-containing flavoprotein (pyridoxamine 5'-phosphate oxidase superfamily)
VWFGVGSCQADRACDDEQMMPTRATIERHTDRAVPDEARRILARGAVAHVGFATDGQPFVIPFSYQFDPARPDRLYLHGSPASRALGHLASGVPVSIAVTLLDGLVSSRTAPHHSMNYRSVILFGTARQVTDASEKARVFEQMIGRYFPGRTPGREYQAATAEQLSATAVVEVRIQEMSAKLRAGGPNGPLDGDAAAPGTCGVVELDPGEAGGKG